MERRLFVQITPGLESALADELRELGLDGRIVAGGVEFADRPEALYAIHLHSRLAARVRLRVAGFKATNLEALAQGIRRVPWARWVHPRQPVQVLLTSRASRLRHRDTVAKKVEHAIADSLRGPRISGGRRVREPIQIAVRIIEDRVEVSVDSSGDLLHRRGWRQATAKAPLRENLAAAVLRVGGWGPGEPLVDLMCGAGTFPIEAATVAMGRPPGARRSFAFERWPSHDPGAWEAAQRWRPPVLDERAEIWGVDRDPGAIRAARANADRAGVGGRILLRQQPMEALQPPASAGLVVVNPPYGRRIGEAAGVYGALGRALRARWGGWRLAVLVPDTALYAKLGLDLEERARFSNGGIEVRLAVGEVSGGR